ncbi:DNA-binding phosphoprotein [Orf virus]|uniref:Protein OPG079 n=1 Tax=Orf virus TaxID=10258 RepID=A0A0R8HS77_ORFV|nr:DNA-binding phosphoprotein [Orf virus]AIZ05284.1 DNA-binding phosphoprotein [Orf virus]AKU76653.1 DNA-binding phosphoprotein [Orf virus]
MKRAVSKTTVASNRAPPQQEDVAPARRFGENQAMSCADAINFAKSLSSSQTKAIDAVTLTPSQYPSCSNINVCLVESLASKLVSPLIVVKGEFKIYMSKKTDMQRQNDSGYFARFKPVSASPLLYQLLEKIYDNIKTGTRVPPSLRNFNTETAIDNTFKSGCMYLNRLTGALLEFTGDDDAQSQICPLMREIENLATRDAQMATLILAPVVFYRSGGEGKVTFAVKKITMPRECSLTVLGLEGEQTCVRMSETQPTFTEEQDVRGLGVVDPGTGFEDDELEAPFNI